jgi:hypothetical protein
MDGGEADECGEVFHLTPVELTAESVRAALQYDAGTGVFTWRAARGCKRAGSIAGSIRNDGYRCIRLFGNWRYAHRLAWLWVTGAWPEIEIDHIDGDRSNNKFANLRDVSRLVNGQNLRRAKSCSQSGVLGVYRRGNKHVAQICVAGVGRNLGTFATAEAAHAAYIAEKRIWHEGNTL